MEVLANASIMALASLFVCVLPLAMAIVYAIWPAEPRLALVRTMSLAAVFSSVGGTALGFINVLRHIGVQQPSPEFTSIVAVGAAESLVPLFFGFGCLTVTWLCVTIGLWRQS
jgi:hypothetical protein